MATKYGVNATKRDNQTIKDLEAQGEKKSPLLVAFDSYTLTAALLQNDVIKLMKLPPLARVHEVVINFSASLDAAAGTIDVGWEANGVDAVDVDGFMDAIDATAAASFIMSDDEGARPGMFKQFGNAETQVTLTVTHSGGLDATSGTVNLAVYYSVS